MVLIYLAKFCSGIFKKLELLPLDCSSNFGGLIATLIAIDVSIDDFNRI